VVGHQRCQPAAQARKGEGSRSAHQAIARLRANTAVTLNCKVTFGLRHH
jgi:hypothetical protein